MGMCEGYGNGRLCDYGVVDRDEALHGGFV